MRIDLGCGPKKREGFFGVDVQPYEGVDLVHDLGLFPWPIASNSVEEIFSSHALEHLPNGLAFMDSFLREIGRVCKDRAFLEIWTPHARGRNAFLPDHRSFYTEDIWLHWGCLYQDQWKKVLGGWFEVIEFRYVISRETSRALNASNMPPVFAVEYLHSVIEEFGVFVTFHKSGEPLPSQPHRTWAHSRYERSRSL